MNSPVPYFNRDDDSREPNGKQVVLVRDRTAMTMPTTNLIELQPQVEHVRAVTAVSPTKFLRRVLFVWLRIYVRESRGEKQTGVNLHIPLPIPILGVALRRQLSWTQALQVVSLAQNEDDGGAALSARMESWMGLEFVRVDERRGNKSTLVIVGLD